MTLHVQSLTLLHDRFPTLEHYPFCLPIFNNTDSLEFTTPVTVFLGENGTGKSTLLEALARACDVHIWKFTETARRFHVNAHEQNLQFCLKVLRPDGRVPGSYFGSEIFRDFKLLLDEWAVSDPRQLKYFGGESLVTKSHGQSMMAYFRSRYRIKGVYFLDEPETGLSPTSQLQLLDIINE
ncbi:MAG: AAA family ATPase, partial [Proteobacteria bacterium]|nr:AAA family ATPase [Pseudomonadota bacterium]MBU1612771.1 AAA family ATPase [Pseudomonadota bacterium]